MNMRGNPAGTPQKSRFTPAVLASVDASALARHLKVDATTFHTCSVDRALGHVRLYESISPGPGFAKFVHVRLYEFGSREHGFESSQPTSQRRIRRIQFHGTTHIYSKLPICVHWSRVHHNAYIYYGMGCSNAVAKALKRIIGCAHSIVSARSK